MSFLSDQKCPIISVAPMMDWTDRHDRFFLRMIAPHILLYTEMITAQAIHHGDSDKLLAYDPSEHPLALQLGGSDPVLLAEAARLGQNYGYDEINLNVGCPSPRVSAGRFGACLMLEPGLVADCIAAMRQAVSIPVTVKCRIGVDEQDDYAFLTRFIETITAVGCDTFIIHARKAWLKGLSPKQNREIPPLQYEVVKQIKRDYPKLTIIINGGFQTIEMIDEILPFVDGVMVGRMAYHQPYFLAEIEAKYFNNNNILNRRAIIRQMFPYIRDQLENGVRLASITRHMLGLFQGMPGAAKWRRYLSEHAHKHGAGVEVVEQALALVHDKTSEEN
jgi:tRNA-dihydrouridine synthase A